MPDELLKSSKVVAPSADVVRVETAAEFGRVLRRRRKELGHTQAEVAALCHVGVRFLSELERGKATAELGRALKVARRLGLELQLAPRSPVPPQWPAK